MRIQVDYTSAIAALKQADPFLAEVIERVGLCTLQQNQRRGDLLFSLSESILHQQLSTKVAVIIHQRFLQLYPSLPTALDILNTADADLRGVGISRPKILYLKDLAQKILDAAIVNSKVQEVSAAARGSRSSNINRIKCSQPSKRKYLVKV